MVSKNWIAGLVGLAAAAVGIHYLLPSLGFGSKSYTLCASRNTVPTPGQTATVTHIVVEPDGSHLVTYSDGTSATYSAGSEGASFNVGDKVTNSLSC